MTLVCLLAASVALGGLAAAAGSGLAVKVTLGTAPAKMVTAPPGQNASPGTTALYLFRLQNTSSAAQTYRLSVASSPAWKTSLPGIKSGKAGPLNPGQGLNVTVAVVVPRSARVGVACTTTLTATTVSRPRLTGSDAVVTTVVSPSLLSLQLGLAPTVRRGETVTGRATLTNRSLRSYRVSPAAASVSGWPVRLLGVPPDGLTVAPQAEATFIVEVTVPKDAPPAAADALIITAQPQGPLAEHVQIMGTATVLPPTPPNRP